MNLKARRRSKTSSKRPRQYSFLPKPSDVFIGPKRSTHAKTYRPLDSAKPLHVCFRSKFARGKRTMLGNNKLKVNSIVAQISKRYGVKLVKYANVGNHLHMVVHLPGRAMTARRHYSKWIRLLTSRLAFELGGSKKGQPFRDENGHKVKFWDTIPFSRVIQGRRGWEGISRYIMKNELESQGVASEVAIVLAHELFESARALEMPDWRSTA